MLTSSCNDTVVDDILSISCVGDIYFSIRTTRVDVQDKRMGCVNLVCSFPLHSVPGIYELSHTHACPLAFHCIWQMEEVSRRLKDENKVRVFIPLEPYCQIVRQGWLCTSTKNLSSLQTNSPLPYNSLSWFQKFLQLCPLTGFQLLLASGYCHAS